MRPSCPHLSKVLGMGQEISRRDFLDGALLASGAALMAAPASAQTAYTGEGDYRLAAGNSDEVVQSAHSVRDGAWDKAPEGAGDTGEIYDCVVVGGGFAGLSAGLFFQQKGGGRSCLILDNSKVFGGVAKRNELHTFAVIPQSWIVERSFAWLEQSRRLIVIGLPVYWQPNHVD